jgi:hypothetical protein
MMGYVIQYLFFVMQIYVAVDYILFRAHAAYYHIKFQRMEQSFVSIEANHVKLILDFNEKTAELTDEIAVLKEKVVNKKRYKCKTCELFSKT